MVNGNGDRLNQFIEFVTEHSIRTEEQRRAARGTDFIARRSTKRLETNFG